MNMRAWIAALGLMAAVVALFLFVPVPGTSQAASTTVQWTAPSDDVGVVKYDGRYSVTRPDTTSAAAKDAWWVAAIGIPGMPTPGPAGTAQAVVIASLPIGTYYVVVRSKDAAGNWSDWSNVATKIVVDTQPPARIIDLIAR